MKNYYTILELEQNATLEEIKAQHRFLLHAWHPDKFPNAELKAKAEEKLKEINEAYAVLGDPVERRQYDLALERVAPAPAREPAPERRKRYCQSCGLPAQTRYVELHENVGLLVMRRHHAVKGELCKACIDYYFWDMTGKTILLGWWGIISLIVTPFILLNNLVRFALSAGMRRPALQVIPAPSPFWVFSTIGGFFAIALLLFFIAFPEEMQPAYSLAPTRTPVPTYTYTPDPVSASAATPTDVGSDCLRWSDVSTDLIGRAVCVYGKVYKTRFVGTSTFQVLFSDDTGSLFLAAGRYYYRIEPGDCVVARGEVLRSGAGAPYLNIDQKLYQCEPWMEAGS